MYAALSGELLDVARLGARESRCRQLRASRFQELRKHRKINLRDFVANKGLGIVAMGWVYEAVRVSCTWVAVVGYTDGYGSERFFQDAEVALFMAFAMKR